MTFTVGHFKKTLLKLLNITIGQVICFKIFGELVGNLWDIGVRLVQIKVFWNNWVVLKRTD